MLERPQQPALSSRTFQPAASSSSIAARPIAGSVKVVNESARNTTSPCAPRAGRARLRSQRSSVSRAKRGSGRRRSMPATRSSSAARRSGRFESGAVAAPSRLSFRIAPNSRERSGVPCCGLVVREELRLHRRHVDAQRALALARLALEAEVEDLVQPLVAQRGARVGLGERLDERVGAPAGGVLLLARGHVGRAHHALARSCGRRRCAGSGRRRRASRRARRRRSGSAAARRAAARGRAGSWSAARRRPSRRG